MKATEKPLQNKESLSTDKNWLIYTVEKVGIYGQFPLQRKVTWGVLKNQCCDYAEIYSELV